MAVNLTISDDVEFGQFTPDWLLAAITVAVTCNISSLVNDDRFASHWGSLATDQGWIIAARTSDNVLFGVHQFPTSVYKIFKTNTNDITGLVRIVCTWSASEDQIEIWVNGVNKSIVQETGGSPSTLASSTNKLTVGHEIEPSLDAVDGDYSEFAIWDHKVPDWVAAGYGKGMSPGYYRRGGLLYSKLANTGYLRDEWGGINPTGTGDANAIHPSMYRPRRRIGFHKAADVTLSVDQQVSVHHKMWLLPPVSLPPLLPILPIDSNPALQEIITTDEDHTPTQKMFVPNPRKTWLPPLLPLPPNEPNPPWYETIVADSVLQIMATFRMDPPSPPGITPLLPLPPIEPRDPPWFKTLTTITDEFSAISKMGTPNPWVVHPLVAAHMPFRMAREEIGPAPIPGPETKMMPVPYMPEPVLITALHPFTQLEQGDLEDALNTNVDAWDNSPLSKSSTTVVIYKYADPSDGRGKGKGKGRPGGPGNPGGGRPPPNRDPENITVDKWFTSFSQEFRSPAMPPIDFQAPAAPVDFGLENITVDKWHSPFSQNFHRDRIPPTDFQAPRGDSDFVSEIITVDKYYREWGNPVLPTSGELHRALLDTQHRMDVDPLPDLALLPTRIPWDVPLGHEFHTVEFNVIPEIASFLNLETAEPVHPDALFGRMSEPNPRDAVPNYYATYDLFPYSVVSPDEAITIDKWYTPFTQEFRSVKMPVYLIRMDVLPEQGDVEQVLLDKYYTRMSGPTRLTDAERYGYLTVKAPEMDPVPIPTVPGVIDMVFSQLSEPVLARPTPLHDWFLFQDFVVDIGTVFVPFIPRPPARTDRPGPESLPQRPDQGHSSGIRADQADAPFPPRWDQFRDRR